MSDETTFDCWVLLELMGHRKIAGHATEETIGGSNLIRIDVFLGDAEKPILTQYYGGNSVYCMTPISEELARKYAAYNRPHPVAVWEMEGSKSNVQMLPGFEADHEEDPL